MSVRLQIATPIPEAASDAVARLHLQSTAGAIIEALTRVANAGIAARASSHMTDEISKRTGVCAAALRDDVDHLIAARVNTADDPLISLARRLLAQRYDQGLCLRHTPDGRLWAYDGAVWKVVEDKILTRQFLDIVRESQPGSYGPGRAVAIAKAALETLKFLQARPRLLLSPEDPAPPVVNLATGEFWLDAGGGFERRPHRPWSNLQHQLPIRFDPDMDCPLFKKLLQEVFKPADDPEGMVRHVEEIMAYAMQPRRDIPAVVILKGAGANGKSTCLSVLSALLGSGQVYHGSAATLSADRFSVPDLQGKLAFIDDDARDGVKLDEGLLKKIAENKPIALRRAHAASTVTFRATVLPIFATNGTPRIDDSSHGLERRLYVIPFSRRFEKAEQDPRLAEVIIATELPGVLNQLLAAHSRLRQRGGFLEPQDCLQAKAALLATANPLRAFLLEACAPAPGKRTELAVFYKAFIAWCGEQRITLPFSRNKLRDRLESAGYAVHKSVGKPVVADLVLL